MSRRLVLESRVLKSSKKVSPVILSREDKVIEVLKTFRCDAHDAFKATWNKIKPCIKAAVKKISFCTEDPVHFNLLDLY